MAVAGAVLLLTALQFCCTRRRSMLLGSLLAVLAIGGVLAGEFLTSSIVTVALALALLLIVWALARCDQGGVVLALLALTQGLDAVQWLAAPITAGVINCTPSVHPVPVPDTIAPNWTGAEPNDLHPVGAPLDVVSRRNGDVSSPVVLASLLATRGLTVPSAGTSMTV